MILNDEEVEEFGRIYEEESGEKISHDEAREMAERVLTLYAKLAEPLPRETEKRKEDA